jgi:hypothetical protein
VDWNELNAGKSDVGIRGGEFGVRIVDVVSVSVSVQGESIYCD